MPFHHYYAHGLTVGPGPLNLPYTGFQARADPGPSSLPGDQGPNVELANNLSRPARQANCVGIPAAA